MSEVGKEESMAVVTLHGRTSGRQPVIEKGQLLAALDIGSSKVSCLIAEALPPKYKSAPPELKFLGHGYQIARGMKAGAVCDIDEAERSIRLAVDAAERSAKQTISAVYLNVSGGRPQALRYKGTISTTSGQVTSNDVNIAISTALAHIKLHKRTILHVNPVYYDLDAAQDITIPLGLFGDTLTAHVNVVSVETAQLRNLSLAAERAHLDVKACVITPYAAAKAVLTADEITLGAILIDLGSQITSLAVFQHGYLTHTDMLPLGGQSITNDISHGFSTNLAHAERMKTLWGSVLTNAADEREMLNVPLLGECGIDNMHKLPKSMLINIISARAEEIFELIAHRLTTAGFDRLSQYRVVLTGGGSQLTGIRELASYWLKTQVRLGVPYLLKDMPEMVRGPGFSVCAGLLAYALNPDTHYAVPERLSQALEKTSAQPYVMRVGRWLKDSL